MRRTFDVFGNLRSVSESTGSWPVGQPNPTWGSDYRTRYTYDVAGRLLTVQDHASNQTTLTYDLLGRKTAMHDPDMGNWQYGYDAVGNLLRQVDARGQVTCSYYDQVNRLQGKHYRGDANCPATMPAFTGQNGVMASYAYDETGFGASLVLSSIEPGRRTRADAYQADGVLNNRATWTYDLRGRTIQETRTINGSGGGTFATEWGYDAADRPRWMKYPGTPAVEQVATEYTARGLVARVSASGIDYVQDTAYDEAGRVLQRDLGSLPVLRTSYWYYGWTDPNGRGRVGTISTHKLSAPTGEVQSLHYWYDAGGNVSQVSFQTPDPEAPIGRGYQYDALDRLTRVNWMSPGTPFLLESYAYAETGNLVARSSGGTPYAYTYGTQADDCPEGALTKAHAVVAATTPTYGPATYCYDQNGNLRRQVIGGEKVFSFSYDSENHLVTISGDDTATYVYDADGQRVKASFGNALNVTTVVYVGSHFEQHTAGSTVSTTKYYFAGGLRVAMRTQTGTSDVLHWLLSDTLGSTTTAAGANGELVASAFYEAWGEMTPVVGDLPTARRYTGQTYDAVIAGIYYYGARYYDPALGRFLQADTIVPSPENPQSLNRYSYVLNNSLRYVDPTGHAVCEDVGCLNTRSAVFGFRSSLRWVNPYGIRFTAARSVTWHANDIRTVLVAANRIAIQLSRVVQHEARLASRFEGAQQTRVIRPAQIFQRVMGAVTFDRSSGSCGQNCWADTIDWPTIRVYSAVKAEAYTFQNATHELGHGFDRQASWAPRTALDTGNIDYTDEMGTSVSLSTGTNRRQAGFYQKCDMPCTWQANPAHSAGEEFADMFLGWTYNHFADNIYGDARFHWMETHMSLWVSGIIGRQ